MSSTTVRGGIIYAKIKDVEGKWRRLSTELPAGTDERVVASWIRERERKVDLELRRRRGEQVADDTLSGWVAKWAAIRSALGLDGNHDAARIRVHVLPTIGHMRVADIRPAHLVELFAQIRKTPIKTARGIQPPAPRTVHNVYSALCACFRDSMLEDPPLTDRSPCILTERQLGAKIDSDREWRPTALLSRDEALTLISSPKIPQDRRVAYAIELLTGLRPGETAALRWRHYDLDAAPLRALLVASALETKRGTIKPTKTGVVKVVPVHSTLAMLLDEWRAGGWQAQQGREPTADDLIVPLPPDDARARTRRKDAEPFRTYYYAGRRWRDQDLPALEWRTRRHYDLRSTFVTLCLDDGADQEVIEHAVTHVRRSGSAFAGYARGDRWLRACAEVAKLRISLGPSVVHAPNSSTDTDTSWLRRRASNTSPVLAGDIASKSKRALTAGRVSPKRTAVDHAGPRMVHAPCDALLTIMRASQPERKALTCPASHPPR